MKITDKKLVKLLEYIRQEIAPEPLSGLMPGGPIWQLEAIGLLDEIAKIWDIPKEAIGEIINGDVATSPGPGINPETGKPFTAFPWETQ